MKSSIVSRIIIGLLISVLFIGILVFNTIKTPSNPTLKVIAIDKAMNLPLEQVIRDDKAHFDLRLIKTTNDLVAVARQETPDMIIMDLTQYLIHFNYLSQYQIAWIRNQPTDFIVDKNHVDIDKINGLKTSIVAVEDQSLQEYLLAQMVNDEKIGISMDEMIINSSYDRVTLLNNSEINFAFTVSPYSDWAVASGGKIINQFDQTEGACDVVLMKSSTIEDNIDIYKAFQKNYNGLVSNQNQSHPDYKRYSGNIWLPNDFDWQSMTYEPFETAEPSIIDKPLSWLYANQRISVKYDISILRSDMFK